MGRPSELVFPDQQILASVAVAAAGSSPHRTPCRFSDRFSRRERAASSWNERGCRFPAPAGPDTVYRDLLLKPLFSFAGKGIQFDPTQAQLAAIPAAKRGEYLLQQRMTFVPTIETPHGLTQAEIRILYLWPDRGTSPRPCRWSGWGGAR